MNRLLGQQDVSAQVIPNVEKIAILRANALGDFIFALPALEALRSTYPQAEIVLLARSWHQEFLAGRPSPIDRVVVIPKGGIGNESAAAQDSAELEQFFAAMRQERFDLAIQMHGGGRNSNPFVLQLGARVTVGLCTPDAAKPDRWMPYVYWQSEIMRYLELVSLVGARSGDIIPKLMVMKRDLQEAEQIFPVRETPIVALHPGATDSRRRWANKKFAAVGDALAAAGATVVVTGTESERTIVEAVVQTMTATAHNLCDRLSLGGLAGLLSRCQVVISNDSGPLHLAAAVGTATVGIYWCGNLITAGLPWRSHHRPILSWRLHCPVCGVNCMEDECSHRSSFVDDVTIDEVKTAALELLALHQPAALNSHAVSATVRQPG